MNHPKEPASGSTSSPHRVKLPQHSRKLITTASISALLSTASALPLSTHLGGGYMTSPPSRNYVAYNTSKILPSASHPMNLLPEIEPTPHSLKSSQYYVGGTCGSADGVRNYDSPMSRLHTLLPLDVQRSYRVGEDIEVSISLYGLDSGGHFEFHLCPLNYPDVPTEECFEKYPLEFVRDVNYNAVKDEKYPERAYLPLVTAFDEMDVVVDDRENAAGEDMMEFRYILKVPQDEELVTYLNGEGPASSSSMEANSQAAGLYQEAEGFAQDTESEVTLADQFISSLPNNRFVLRRRTQSLAPHDKSRIAASTNVTVSPEGTPQQWYATQVDGGYTVSHVPTVPISSIVTDGNGTTTITTLEGVTVLTGGAKVPASMTTTWGDASIYGTGIDLEVDRPPAPETTAAPETSTGAATTSATVTVGPDEDWPVNDVVPQSNQPQQEPQTVSASIPPNSKPGNNSTKYVLLRWHYETSLDCYPQGYDTYPWPQEWGNWSKPWAGQCNVTSTQDHYWNCAEIQITSQQQDEMVTYTQSKNDPPQAMPDMILVGKNELAYLNVLANDTDPNGDVLHLVEVEEASHGYVALLEGKKELIYAPDRDFEGLDSFEYTVCDEYGQCDTAKIDVLVGSNSDLIFAKDDRAETTGTEQVVVDVTANDVLQRAGQTNVQSSDPLIVTEVTGTKRGTCSVTVDNQVKYQASEVFLSSQDGQAQDRCRYIVCLGENSDVCDEGWLSIKILLADDNDDSLEDVSVEITSQGDDETKPEIDAADSLHEDMTGSDMQAVLSNIGSDGSGDIVALDDDVITDSHDEPFKIDVLKNDEYVGTPYLTDVTAASSGKCTLTEDNQVLYTPTPGFVGLDRCKYTVCVEEDVCDEGRIKIQAMMLPQDTSFSSNIVTNTDKATVETGKPLVIDVAANDVALGSSQPLVVTDASPALHGGCSVTNDNQVVYISKAGFTGWDRCQYTVCMGKTCNVGQIGVKVMPQGSPAAEITPEELQPNAGEVFSISMARPDAVTVEAGKTTYLDVLANDIKSDGDEWSIESVTHPNFGNAQIVFGRVEYTPVDEFVGLDSFEYTVCDNHGHCDSATVIITVSSNEFSSNEDDSAVEVFAEDDEATVKSSETMVIDVTANDHSTSQEPLVLSSVGDSIHGACVITSGNKIEYTAPDNFVGYDRCTYSVCAEDTCDKGRIEITVLAQSSKLDESTPAGSINVASPSNADEDKIIPPSDATEVESETSQSSFGGITIMSEPVSVGSDDKRMHADDDSVVTLKNVAILVDVTVNDFIEGMNDLTITHAGGSKHGTCLIEGRKVRYTPYEDYTGKDRCGYIVCQDSECDEGIIRIEIVSDSAALKHDKSSSTFSLGGIGNTRSSSAQLCSQSAMNHGMRRLRGRAATENRRLETETHSSCVGSSLVTTVSTPTQTITYTSTYHSKENRSTSPRTRTFDLHSKIRSYSKSQVEKSSVDTEISLAASEDATIIPGFPDQNFGFTESMLVSSTSSKSGRHDAFLKFDTSLVDTSVCSDGIVSARVTVYALASSAEGGTFLTTPNSMAWSENDITWNNAPSSNGIVLESLGKVQAKTFYDIDVSSALRLGKILSVHILPGSSSQVSAQYATKDHSDSSLHPTLRISCISYDGPELDQK